MRILDIRHHQPARGRRRNAQVHKTLDLNLAVRPRSVHLGVPFGRPNHGGGKHQQRSYLHALEVARLLQTLDKFHGARGIDIYENRYMRGAKRRRNHSFRRCLAHPAHRNVLHTIALCGRGLPETLARGFLHVVKMRHIVQQVLFRHLPARAGRGHIRQIDAQLFCRQTHRWRRQRRTMRHRLLRRLCGYDGYLSPALETLHNRIERAVLYEFGGAFGKLAEKPLIARLG